MTFDEVEKHIDLSHGPRIPQALNEMMWTKPLAQYINKKFSRAYTEVRKEYGLDKAGIDIVLSEGKSTKDVLLIQLTYAREYDMSPSAQNKIVDLTGKAVLEAIQRKCELYSFRGIDTHNMILLVQGVLPVEYIAEILDEKLAQLPTIKNIECFDGIYYVSDKVYALREINFN